MIVKFTTRVSDGSISLLGFTEIDSDAWEKEKEFVKRCFNNVNKLEHAIDIDNGIYLTYKSYEDWLSDYDEYIWMMQSDVQIDLSGGFFFMPSDCMEEPIAVEDEEKKEEQLIIEMCTKELAISKTLPPIDAGKDAYGLYALLMKIEMLTRFKDEGRILPIEEELLADMKRRAGRT
jgi:hypothetical protein